MCGPLNVVLARGARGPTMGTTARENLRKGHLLVETLVFGRNTRKGGTGKPTIWREPTKPGLDPRYVNSLGQQKRKYPHRDRRDVGG